MGVNRTIVTMGQEETALSFHQGRFRSDVKENVFTKMGCPALRGCPGQLCNHHPCRDLKAMEMWQSGTGLGGGFGSAGLRVGTQ